MKRNSPEMFDMIASNSAEKVVNKLLDLGFNIQNIKILHDIRMRTYDIVYNNEENKFNEHL